jgi:hypothetical protein
MRSLQLILTLLATAATLALVPTSVNAQDAQVERHSGYIATATFTSTSGCLTTTVSLYLQTRGYRVEGDAPRDPFMDIDRMTIVNDCTGETLLSAYFSTREFSFEVAPQLASATLVASNLTMEECFGQVCSTLAGPLDVAVTWTATGDLVKIPIRFHGEIAGDMRNVTGQETTRPVIATGTISDGATNFTPNPTEDARLSLLNYTWVNAPTGS